MSNLTKCRDCGKFFDPKNKSHRSGYIDQCGRCAKDVPRYLGRMGGAKSNVACEIFRTDLERAQAYINAEKGAGWNANLILSSPKSMTIQRDVDMDDMTELAETKPDTGIEKKAKRRKRVEKVKMMVGSLLVIIGLGCSTVEERLKEYDSTPIISDEMTKAAHMYHQILVSHKTTNGYDYFCRNGQECTLFTEAFLEEYNNGRTRWQKQKGGVI